MSSVSKCKINLTLLLKIHDLVLCFKLAFLLMVCVITNYNISSQLTSMNSEVLLQMTELLEALFADRANVLALSWTREN